MSAGHSLAGITVIDLSRALAGPHAAMMLGDLGAEVIKVEQPGGDDSRGWGPPFVTGGERRESTYFLSCNRNKRSIELDLKDAEDLAVLRGLVKSADVLIENFRPGVMDRLGLATSALHDLNPRLVVLSITGFGHDGPESHRSGYDQIAQGEGGLMSLTGEGATSVQRVGVPIGDLLAGMNGANGVLAALVERQRTGLGKVVRTSLLASIVAAHSFQGTRTTVAGEVPVAEGNHHPTIAPYGLFRCGDGAVQISVGNERTWQRFASHFGIDPDDELFASNADRLRNRAPLIAAIEASFAAYNRDELLGELHSLGVPAGQVRSLDEVYEWPQTLSQRLLVDVRHDTLGTISLPGSALRFFDPDGTETTRVGHRAPPVLDADGPALRAGLEDDEKAPDRGAPTGARHG
ncbi:MAG TPA: CoA transferase [Actinomycetaceae bacterium]|nr:CoA transferase [Actinomycetaceae bacterium]